jgi:tripartite-type tricarboxylate transporter receptor subunit TctC
MSAATSEASIVTLPQVKAGKLRALATYLRHAHHRRARDSDDEGSGVFPTVNIGHWASLFAPRGTPQASSSA